MAGQPFNKAATLNALEAAEKGVDLTALARAVLLELSSRVVSTTPVDTGFLRGSWQPHIGDQPPGGEGVAADYGATVAGMEVGQTFWLTNGAAYARRLEEGFTGKDKLGRNYNQAGRHWVRAAVEQVDAIVAQKVRDLA